MITYLVFKSKVRPQKYKQARYAVINVSKKDLSNIIREFEKFQKSPYENNMPKHEPTDSYFYLARQLTKCMMRSDTLNCHDYGGYTEITAPSSDVNSTDEAESKRIIVHETYRIIVPRTRMNQNASSFTKLYRILFLRTRTNQNASSYTKLYRIIVSRTKANQNTALSKKIYCRTVPRTRTN